MALTRKLPKLPNVVDIICPPSIICKECPRWSDTYGCPEDEETRAIAVWGNCPKLAEIKKAHEREVAKMNRFLTHGEY